MDAFLCNAGLAHLQDYMLAEGVTVDLLLLANDAELSQLTTTVADKIKLRSALEKIKQQKSSIVSSDIAQPVEPISSVELLSPSCSDTSTVSVALPERQSILILGPGGSLEGTPFEDTPRTPLTPVQATTLQATDKQAIPQATPPETCTNQKGSFVSKEFSFMLDGEEFDFLKDIDTNCIIEETPSQLHNLLSKHVKGKLLIEKAKKGEPLTSRDRCYIVSLVVETELHLLQKINQTIRKDVWQKWSHEIATLFKGETKELYYVPYHIIEGKVIQASGLIHNRLITQRRSLGSQSTPRKRSVDSESSDSGCSSEPSETTKKRVRPLPDEFHDINQHVNAEESLDWLRGSSSPKDILINKWRATFALRAQYLKEISYTDYFQNFPGLRLPSGYELLISDFEAVYPIANKTYTERFPLVKLKLLNLLAERAESSKSDPTIVELLELASINEEQANIAALLGIVALLRQMHTVTVPKKKLWRLTREETRRNFLARVPTVSDISMYCAQRDAFNFAKGTPNQAYILAVGPSWTNINHYEIVTNAGGLRYQVPTICEAIKVTYNLYWALDCAYPKAAAPCWMFIQRAIFEMKSKFDVEGVPLRELLLQLHSIK